MKVLKQVPAYWAFFLLLIAERFSFYGFRSTFVLNLVNNFSLPMEKIGPIYGYFIMAISISGLIAPIFALISDKYFTPKKTLNFSISFLLFAFLLLSIATFFKNIIVLYIGLGFLVLGILILKFILFVVLSLLYNGEKKYSRTLAFIFIIFAINIGSFGAPLVSGILAEKYNYILPLIVIFLFLFASIMFFNKKISSIHALVSENLVIEKSNKGFLFFLIFFISIVSSIFGLSAPVVDHMHVATYWSVYAFVFVVVVFVLSNLFYKNREPIFKTKLTVFFSLFIFASLLNFFDISNIFVFVGKSIFDTFLGLVYFVSLAKLTAIAPKKYMAFTVSVFIFFNSLAHSISYYFNSYTGTLFYKNIIQLSLALILFVIFLLLRRYIPNEKVSLVE